MTIRGKIQTTFRVDAKLLRRFQHALLDRDTKMTPMIEMLIRNWMAENIKDTEELRLAVTSSDTVPAELEGYGIHATSANIEITEKSKSEVGAHPTVTTVSATPASNFEPAKPHPSSTYLEATEESGSEALT